MRFIAILMILAGLVLAVFYPVYQSDHTGTEVAKIRVFDRVSPNKFAGWKEVRVQLNSAMNPLRLRVAGSLLPVAAPLAKTTNIEIKIQGPNGPIYSGILDVHNQPTNENQQPKSVRLWRVSPEINVTHDGVHTISIENQGGLSLGLEYLDISVVSNVEEVTTDYRVFGFGLMGLGILLYSLFRKRRKSNRSKDSKKYRKRDDDDDDDDDEDEDDDDDEDEDEDEDDNIWNRKPKARSKPSRSQKKIKAETSMPAPQAEPKPKAKKPRFKWGRQPKD